MKSYLDKIFILEGILLAIIGVLFFINPVNAFFNFTTIYIWKKLCYTLYCRWVYEYR